jgi:delta 1-pyrroline-5-carboxylate dehydrogenase
MATRKPPAAAWKPGQSGNPRGRKPGTGEVAKLRAAIADRVPELLAAMMARALDGDVGAARLLLERAIAPLKAAEQSQALSLPDGTLTDQGRAVLASVATGELAPGQDAALLGLAPGDRDLDLDRRVLERSLSVNTAAAGGNVSLMTIG